METLNFELPKVLWKVTKRYATLGVPFDDLEKVLNSSEIWFFQSEDLAREMKSSFKIGDEEFIQISEGYGYKLPIYVTIEQVNTIDYIPKVLDF